MEKSATYDLISFAAVGVATVIAAKRNKRFKMRLPVFLPKLHSRSWLAMGIFSIAYEMTVKAQRYPERYDLAGANLLLK